jgi:glyoxylase-like metal-dependent hydrolase (beta-lactamase superfamily II)
MAIHILNCASMSPWWPRWHLGSVCLLVDTNQGPLLVDTGLGLHDYAHPSKLVRFYIADFGIHMDPEIATVHQITRFGWKVEDVRNIVMTHLHFDHAGGACRIFRTPGFTFTNLNTRPGATGAA